jgi:hypothetical protein
MFRASVLASPPLSGSIPEVRFHAFGNCTWVRLESDADEPWASVFGNSDARYTSFQGAILSTDHRHCFVLATGRAYCVDTRARSAECVVDDEPFHSAIALKEPATWLVGATSNLLILNRTGISSNSTDLAIDGIMLDSAAGNIVTGKVWKLEGWYRSRFYADARSFEQLDFLSSDWFEFMKLRRP